MVKEYHLVKGVGVGHRYSMLMLLHPTGIVLSACIMRRRQHALRLVY